MYYDKDVSIEFCLKTRIKHWWDLHNENYTVTSIKKKGIKR